MNIEVSEETAAGLQTYADLCECSVGLIVSTLLETTAATELLALLKEVDAKRRSRPPLWKPTGLLRKRK